MNEHLNTPIKLAVSSCLNGEAVRYDGSDTQNAKVKKYYSRYFNLLTICPETAIGLGVPRRPIKMIQDVEKSGNFRLVDRTDSTLHYTNRMLNYAKHQIDNLYGTCGYIVKERSPSCGLESTPRFSIGDELISYGTGFFTDQIRHNMPWLPIISESGLEEQQQQNNFLERLFVLHLWNVVYKNNKQFDKFYALIKHQIELRGRDSKSFSKLKNNSISKQDKNYISDIMEILKIPVTINMQITFLNNIIQEFSLISKQMTHLISSYQNKKDTLWYVIQQFQQVLKEKNIKLYSNYFYPDQRELITRKFYFES